MSSSPAVVRVEVQVVDVVDQIVFGARGVGVPLNDFPHEHLDQPEPSDPHGLRGVTGFNRHVNTNMTS